jgi:hypothetical protein
LSASGRTGLRALASTEISLLHATARHLLAPLGGTPPEGFTRLCVGRPGLVEALLRRGIAILRALAVLRIVLPLARAAIVLVRLFAMFVLFTFFV